MFFFILTYNKPHIGTPQFKTATNRVIKNSSCIRHVITISVQERNKM